MRGQALSSLLLAGCSLVANPDDHLGGARDAGMDAMTVPDGGDAGTDGGRADAGACQSLLLSGGSISLPANAAYDLEAFTLEAWVRPDAPSFGGDRNVASRWGRISAGTGSYGLFLRAGAPSLALSCDGTQYDVLLFGSTALREGTWEHVAVTLEETGMTARVWLNGVSQAEMTVPCWPHDASAADFTIAHDDPDGGDPFEGRIDDLRLSDVARYTAGFTPPGRHAPDSDTVLLFDFEGEGASLTDRSNTANHAAVAPSTSKTPGICPP